MSTCARCGHELGVGRFCTNCGHPIGQPVPESEVLPRPGEQPLPVWQEPDRRPWVLVAAGAALALLLLIVLVSCLGGDDDQPGEAAPDRAGSTSTPRDETPASSTQPTPVNVAARATVQAPAPAPPTTDLDGTLVAYTAAQLVDGAPETCWRVAGDGSGSTLTFTLRRPTTLTRVGLVNGYAKQVPDGATVVDWYPLNRRITSVEWTFDDGTVVAQDLREVPRMQARRIDPVTTRTVRLTIRAVSAPGAGPMGRDYTAISEVLLSGTRA